MGYYAFHLPTILVILNIGLSVQQDGQNFYYTHGRFTPSFQNPRNGFFSPETLSQQNSPGSYHQQTLYLGNQEQETTPEYFAFSSFPVSQQSDYFEITPRPYTIQPAANHGLRYARPPPRPAGVDYHLNRKDFKPIVQQPKSFVEPTPEQPKFSESTTDRPLFTRQRQRSRTIANEPISVNSEPIDYNSNKFLQNQSYRDSNSKYVTSHESSIRSKNRFQPSVVSTTIATTAEPQKTRRNRFSPRTSYITTKSSQLTSTPSFNTRENKLIRQQPAVFGSKNVILHRNLKQSFDTKNFTQNENKKNINESAEKTNIHESHFSDDDIEPAQNIDEYYYDNTKTKEQPNHVKDIEDPLINPVSYVKQNVNLEDTNKNVRKNEEEATIPKDISNTGDELTDSDDHTVILHSNFYLPENSQINEDQVDDGPMEGYHLKYESIPEVKSEVKENVTINPGLEYEYEYDYYDDESTTIPVNDKNMSIDLLGIKKEPAVMVELKSEPTLNTTVISSDNAKDNILGKAVVSVVTTKSVVNGSTSNPGYQEYTQEPRNVSQNIHNIESNESDSGNSSTESWVVIASIQTSRSVSGARFLPFPQVEQEEKKQILTDVIDDDDVSNNDNDDVTKELKELIVKEAEENTAIISDDKEISTTSTLKPEETTAEHNFNETTSPKESIEIIPSSTTEHTINISLSTESIIDKLDRVQSELSSGLLTGKFPILNEMPDIAPPSTKSPAVIIRRFTPRTTTVKPENKITLDSLPMDELSGLLPFGFKPRNNSYRNKKITSTTVEPANENSPKLEVHPRNATISRSFKSSPSAQDISLAGLLPKDYKLNTNNSSNQSKLSELLSKIKFEDKLDTFLPKDYIDKTNNKSLPSKVYPLTVTDAVNKFLPSDYKRNKESSTTKPLGVLPISDDISKFLPPGYKNVQEDLIKKKTSAYIPVADDISKFLPQGYKPPTEESNIPSSIPITDDIANKLLPHGYKSPSDVKTPILPKIVKINDISNLLPPGFKLKEEPTTENTANSILNKIKFKDVSDLLPPGYKANVTSDSEILVPVTTTKNPSGLKVVFPKGIKRPISRITTHKPGHLEGPSKPEISIRKGLPTRATTEFTGWPTVSTTPLSIEKLLEMQGAQTIDISELLGRTSTTTTTVRTTTTTTTKTTTVKPTQPGLCREECNLAGTIKIVDGVKWSPELLDHNTDEWKNLAREVEAQLNDVYSKSNNLSKWYKKIRIDSFSKGSVLVDYFVELSDVSHEINTLEIKRMFHEALKEGPTSVVPLNGFQNNNDDELNIMETASKTPTIKETVILGKFILDPISTDFIVIPKQISPTIEYAEQNSLIPQWAIAVIVIGMASLMFVIIFGVTVLVNRQKKSKKKAPVALTADMLNELNKNHMGGLENYDQDDFYNPDDTWSDSKHAIKAKRFTNSLHGSNSNIYDSWRSKRRAEQQYYESQNYPQKTDPYPPDTFSNHQQNAMGMYTYNPRRFHRDYDPEF